MRDSIVFYKSFYDAIKKMPQEYQLELYNAIFMYSFEGIEPTNLSSISEVIFTLTKPNIDSAQRKYKARVDNGNKGGRPKKNNPTKTEQKPNNNLTITEIKPNDKPNNNLNVYDNVNVDDNDTVNGNVNNIQTDDFYSEELKYFCERFNINIDGYNGDLSNIDFSLLVKCYDESKSFLQEKPFAKNLSWICKNYKKIIANTFRDYESKPDSGGSEEKTKGYWDDALSNLGRID